MKLLIEFMSVRGHRLSTVLRDPDLIDSKIFGLSLLDRDGLYELDKILTVRPVEEQLELRSPDGR